MFTIIPTRYFLYRLVNADKGELAFVNEFSTKGAAIKWIDKEGETGVQYVVKEVYTKK
jgi:hypothetical protein